MNFSIFVRCRQGDPISFVVISLIYTRVKITGIFKIKKKLIKNKHKQYGHEILVIMFVDETKIWRTWCCAFKLLNQIKHSNYLGLFECYRQKMI